MRKIIIHIGDFVHVHSVYNSERLNSNSVRAELLGKLPINYWTKSFLCAWAHAWMRSKLYTVEHQNKSNETQLDMTVFLRILSAQIVLCAPRTAQMSREKSHCAEPFNSSAANYVSPNLNIIQIERNGRSFCSVFVFVRLVHVCPSRLLVIWPYALCGPCSKSGE